MGGDEDAQHIGGGVSVHVVVFVVVNLLLIAIWLLGTAGAQLDQVPTYLTHPSQAKEAGFWPLYVLVFWGAGLAIHAGIMIVTAPSRYRRRRARAKARRQLQANVIGVLGDTFLSDAAVAGIRAVDGDKAARKVEREAARNRSRNQAKVPAKDRSKDSKGRSKDGAKDGAKERSSDGATPGTRDRSGRGPTEAAPVGSRPEPRGGRSSDRRAEPRTPAAPVPEADAVPSPSPAPPAASPAGRQWVAVLFTDIVDSTALNHRLGDGEWARLLAEHRSLVRECVTAHAGAEVGTQGDGFLLRFDEPDHAAACAVEIQQRLLDARAARGDQAPLHVRIGMHAGEVVRDDDDIIGKVINLAARVTTAAAADEILVTEPFADHLSAGHILMDRGLKSLKGFTQPRHLLALAWQVVPDEIVLDDRSDR